MAGDSNQSCHSDLINIFDHFIERDKTRARSYLKNIGFPAGLVEEAVDSDRLARLLTGRLNTIEDCWDEMGKILNYIPRKDLLTHHHFRQYFTTKRQRGDDGARRSGEGFDAAAVNQATAGDSNQSCHSDLINIFDHFEKNDKTRARSYLKNIGFPEGRIEEAVDSDRLARLLTGRLNTIEDCWDEMGKILNYIPRKDLLTHPHFRQYFTTKRQRGDDGARRSGEGTGSRQLQKMPPKFGKVGDDLLSKWRQLLAYCMNTTLSIHHMRKLIEYSHSVGFIFSDVSGVTGSGFRLGSKYFITNFHVLSMMLGGNVTQQTLQMLEGRLCVSFNFEQTLTGDLVKVKKIAFVDNKPDFAICELELKNENNPPGLHNLIAEPPIDDGSFIALIGHPDGQPKRTDTRCFIVQNPLEDQQVQEAMHGNISLYGDRKVADFVNQTFLAELTAPDGKTYQSSFLKGASGSPGFDDAGNLVVMHTVGYYIPIGNTTSVIEKGLSMVVIRDYLKQKNPDLAALVFGN
ncbi:serine protease FAM111A-like [Ptychodera flava]|uniref:serine protease FAM111A-like n=1 Tax=Ptychodera flava TaxID=63121 RepID=UPI003969EF82